MLTKTEILPFKNGTPKKKKKKEMTDFVIYVIIKFILNFLKKFR